MSHKRGQLSGKTAIVTGRSRGIGAGICRNFAGKGANVALVYTSDSSKPLVDALIQELSNTSTTGSAIAIQADLSANTTCSEPGRLIVSKTIEAFGHIDIIVNNAAKPGGAPLSTLKTADFESSFRTNTLSPLLLVQAAQPYLGTPGRIMNTSSSISKRGAAGGALLYVGSKAALEAVSRCLAHELGKDGNTVNCVLPGPVDTDMMRLAPKEMIEASMRNTPIEARMGTVDDIADVVAFLASDEARWITGQCLSASGGMVMLESCESCSRTITLRLQLPMLRILV